MAWMPRFWPQGFIYGSWFEKFNVKLFRPKYLGFGLRLADYPAAPTVFRGFNTEKV
jgi:hypothetical protein